MAETWHFNLGEPITVVELGEDEKVKLTCPVYSASKCVDYNISPDGALLKAVPRDAETLTTLLWDSNVYVLSLD
ncbi:hypothetical protein DVH24_041925 [Malus domestica]|uniref:Uncharacterized protein n=1 Tax=Malus domestica TaxID=3750 RepID=A0A498IST4_MALDO|nr:hypothetical protein DVH24_041925 [Malus domestica]